MYNINRADNSNSINATNMIYTTQAAVGPGRRTLTDRFPESQKPTPRVSEIGSAQAKAYDDRALC